MSSAAFQSDDTLALSYADQRQLRENESEMAVLRERLAQMDSHPRAPVMTTEEFFAAFPD